MPDWARGVCCGRDVATPASSPCNLVRDVAHYYQASWANHGPIYRRHCLSTAAVASINHLVADVEQSELGLSIGDAQQLRNR